MHFDTRKIDLITWISTLDSDEILKRLEFFKKTEKDWWDELPKEVKESIDIAEEQFKTGDTHDHESQIEKYKKLL